MENEFECLVVRWASLKMHNQHITVLTKDYMVSLHGEFGMMVRVALISLTTLTRRLTESKIIY